ncbi:helix-turn-helix domain-containing protein [Chitinophaga caseinilytica]|uniref:helix-turn-helix domain-containing protein n=1 Tax=Chitinophaga caseinilytica TaxID=2267521 RepID=UPI003C308CAD
MQSYTPEELSKKVGERIKALRVERGITTRDFADMANISHSYRHEIESGQVNPSLSTLYSIANAFKITLSELLAGI